MSKNEWRKDLKVRGPRDDEERRDGYPYRGVLSVSQKLTQPIPI